MVPKNNSFKNILSPRRKKGKHWDSDAHTGKLWLWTGAFKRWKQRQFDASQPGLLTYTGRQRKKGKAKGGAINLHEAALELSSADGRTVIIRRPGGAKIYLRTIDAEDRPALMDSLQRSAQNYSSMLARASALLGMQPERVELIEALPNGPGKAQLSGEVSVAQELQERMKLRMQEIAPFQEAFSQQVSSLQARLRSVAEALDLATPAPEMPAGESPHSSNDLQPLHPLSEGRADEDAAWDANMAPQAGRVLCHADSFQSALSELQKSPSWHEGLPAAPPGGLTSGPLGATWRALNDAVEDAVRSEAVRVVELQAENEALKAAMRNFKRLAQANARKLRAISPNPADARGGVFHARSDSSDGDDLESTSATPKQSMDLPPTGFSRDVEVSVGSMSPAMSSAYQQALEALEAVRKHAFELSTQPAGVAPDEPPPPLGPDADAEADEEIPSDDERGSRSVINLQVENPWEVVARRERLPAPAPVGRGFSIWSVLKNAIGKDLTRITLPATINEPLSALQRMVEDLEYRHLLDRAAAAADPAERTLFVAAFIASGYSSTLARESKPFNPLLGETFEWQSADSSCRFVCEQVSHHPPISCWWSEGSAGWQYTGEIEVRSKFWGRSVEMMPTGTCWLKLGGELWSWNKANMSINNIILGTYWLDWHGTITLTNHTTGVKTDLVFPKANGRSLDNRGAVCCQVADAHGKHALTLKGRYTDRLTAVPTAAGAEPWEVFRVNPPAPHGALQYNLTSLAMTLNASEPELLRQLPPTDSRFRPDQRALEDGDVTRATPEKLRLEAKQREVREQRKAQGEGYFPLWFKLREMDEAQRAGADKWLGSKLVRLPEEGPPCLWEFTGEYWAAKERLDWASCPDIYS